MVDIESINLDTELTHIEDSGDNLQATLEFDVVFSASEQREGSNYHIVGLLVEVDDELDQYQVDQRTIFDVENPFNLRKKVATFEQTPVGQSDDPIGIIGETKKSADVGRETITFTESLGYVQTGPEGEYLIGSGSQSDIDDEVRDFDEKDPDSTYYKRFAQLRGLVWVAPEGVAKTAFSDASEDIEFTYVGR